MLLRKINPTSEQKSLVVCQTKTSQTAILWEGGNPHGQNNLLTKAFKKSERLNSFLSQWSIIRSPQKGVCLTFPLFLSGHFYNTDCSVQVSPKLFKKYKNSTEMNETRLNCKGRSCTRARTDVTFNRSRGSLQDPSSLRRSPVLHFSLPDFRLHCFPSLEGHGLKWGGSGTLKISEDE